MTVKVKQFHRFKKYAALLIALVLLVTLAAGCGSQSSQSPAKEKVLNFSWAKDIGPLNPHMYNPNQMFAQALVYEPLVQYSADGKIIPWLAESWTISPDGKEYIFKLRPDVKFSDGTPFNAAAVKKNFDAVLANGKRHDWLAFIRQIKETQVIDDNTFKLVLKEAYYPVLQELALIRPIRFLAPAQFPDNGNTGEGIKKPIGTGPWVLSEYKQGEVAVFVRNEHYWGAKPKVDKLVVKIIPDSESRVVAFEKKELDLIYGSGSISMDAFKQLQQSGKYETQLSEPLATRVLAVNSNKGATRALKVRQALQHAVNKDAFVKGVLFGTERKADTLLAANFPYCNLGLKPYEYSEAQAKALLEEAGWQEVPGKEFREKDGEVLELEVCFVSTDAIQKSVAEVLQGDLRKIGIKVKLTGEEEGAISERQKNGNFNLIYSDTWGAPYDPHSLVGSMREPAHADYQAQAGLPMKAEIDRLASDVLVSTDEGKRQEMYKQIFTTLHEQAVYLPLSYLTNIVVYPKNVTGVTFMGSQYEIPFVTMDIQ
ncbi:MAG TPA: nickel ABC transporter substrate-binding protein [Methylomusa anaerophila]|uniref:Nickel-binding periplasmic protein n=1 Tax=Methylomusa anaerophila TaxID=1930071 RepID=A0A348AE83_9FIRM|nr:nickel ABC transporter substrate-binding protein [Methylomusa anaerophila]BBB89381.1 nickel-binding periplasmic protein precursor [Methylomusa anaerophila]HML90457.1 nickel ABC transporter substrate-binding protein [Methylomusa anaerophila]